MGWKISDVLIVTTTHNHHVIYKSPRQLKSHCSDDVLLILGKIVSHCLCYYVQLIKSGWCLFEDVIGS